MHRHHQEYIHRVGRTARAGKEGRALLFVLPSELGYLKYLKAARVELDEYEFPQQKVANVQAQLERLVEKNYYLHKSARDAYRSYLLAYASHSHKHIFDVHALDLQKVRITSLCYQQVVVVVVDPAILVSGRQVARIHGPAQG